MAQTIFVMADDKRLEQIQEQIVRLASADFSTQGVLSDKGDDLDSVVVGLNLLGEELESYTLQLTESEEKLKNTLLQLTNAQALSHIGSWEWDIPTNTIYWTDELYRIYGRERENFESTFENFMACIHPDDREYVNKVVQDGYERKEAFSFSHRVLRPDGVEKVVDCKANVFLNEEGQLRRMTGTAQDITKLRKAEEKITQLAAIVESSSDAIISKTLDGYITSWNQQAEVLFGYTEQEIIGQHISILFPAERLDEETYIRTQVLSGASLPNFETERKRKDGTNFPVAATISAIKDPTGRIIGISNIVRDITENKRAEETLRLYTEALEQKNRESEQFAYIASHDLQEPLRTITNYIGLLNEEYKGSIDKNADVYLTFIESAARRMQTLISDLLEYTTIDNDNKQVDIDCNALVKEVVQDMSAIIEATNTTVQIGNLPEITGQVSRFKSLFLNLIGNAIKFRKPDELPSIQISAKDKGREWQFVIKDNGIGISKEYNEKIFKLFQRLHGRKEYEGTGIGLAHCKKIIDLRGGKIWVESEPGSGSAFYFTVPKTYHL